MVCKLFVRAGRCRIVSRRVWLAKPHSIIVLQLQPSQQHLWPLFQKQAGLFLFFPGNAAPAGGTVSSLLQRPLHWRGMVVPGMRHYDDLHCSFPEVYTETTSQLRLAVSIFVFDYCDLVFYYSDTALQRGCYSRLSLL
jgi:hypothetical protein